VSDRLYIAGSDKQLAETETVLSAKIGKELILDGAMRIVRTHFDLILIDCPPNLGTLTLNALCAADNLVIPSDMSVLALEGVTDILAALQTVRERLGRNVELCGVLVTRYDRRTSKINEMLQRSFGDLHHDRLLATRIPQSAAVNHAHLNGRSVLQEAPGSAAALAYRALAAELAARWHIGLNLQAPAA
jgi:chromosome partitioning protein